MRAKSEHIDVNEGVNYIHPSTSSFRTKLRLVQVTRWILVVTQVEKTDVRAYCCWSVGGNS